MIRPFWRRKRLRQPLITSRFNTRKISPLVPKLQDMAGFRSLLAHRYADVDLGIVQNVVTHHLDNLAEFVERIRERL